MTCPFCSIYTESSEKVIAANEHAYAVYDINPQTKGHALVITKRHVPSYFEITPEEAAAVFDLLRQLRSQLKKEFNPKAFMVRINDGREAGQIIFHAHAHLVPRYGTEPGE